MIQPYIDLGWHTVPLKGKLERLEGSDKKTIPKFEESWRETYTATKNTKSSALGGVITGSISNIVAIDCDNADTWQMFRAIDPYNEHVYISKGKEAGTLIYSYDEEQCDNFSVHEDGLSLDFYSNKGFVYLPTAANKTKVTLSTPLPTPPPLPQHISTLLTRLRKSTQTVVVKDTRTDNNNRFTANYLAPLVKQFNDQKGEYMPGLFRVITPRAFRQYDSYTSNGHLHPNDINDGDGSSYLSSISAILGSDYSVDTEMYVEAMSNINNLFDDPMPNKRLDSTIVNPMINEKSSIDGVPMWRHDPDWSQYRAVFTTKDQSTLEVAYDDSAQVFYAVDSSRDLYSTFTRDTELYNHLQAVTATEKPKKEIIHGTPLVRTVTHPHKDFGFLPGVDATKRDFNTFKATPSLNIFYKPEEYAAKYKRPEVMLKFFETLIPDEQMRNYLLQFLKTKLTTFSYSPVVLYFLGVPGSGKGTFVRIVEEIFGLVPTPTAQEFLDKFNGWVVGSYFVELDEYGDTLSTMREREEAIGKLKALTGKQKVDIRKMRENSYSYEHNITFIMTANKNPLMLDAGDRRIALFNTPNSLMDQSWVDEAGGIDSVITKIISSTPDFCYYLATEVKTLPSKDYMRPPMFEGKFELIADNMPAAARIAYCFKQRQLKYLIELALDYACDNVAQDLQSGAILISVLDDLYQELTQDKGARRSLIKAIRENGNVKVNRVQTDFEVTNFLPKDFTPFEEFE